METATQNNSIVATRPVPPEKVQAYDFRAAGNVDAERMKPLAAASENFAHTLSEALSSRLGLSCEVTAQPSEQTGCRQFLEKASTPSYMVAIELQPRGEMAVVQIEPTLLFPVVDLLLGGSGNSGMITREVTEIEDHIAKGLVRIICEGLQAAWRPFNVEVKMGERRVPLESQTQFTISERAFVFSYDVRMPEGGGGIQLMLPIASSTAFLRTTAKDTAADKSAKKSAMSARLAEKLLESNFELDLALEGCKVQANDLLNLSNEKILRLGLSVRTPVMLQIGGRDCFEAVPVRSGHSRAAQLMDRLEAKTSQGKEQ